MNEHLDGLTEVFMSDDVAYSDKPIDCGVALVASGIAAVAQELRTSNKISRLDMLFRYINAGEGRDRGRLIEEAEALNEQIRDELGD